MITTQIQQRQIQPLVLNPTRKDRTEISRLFAAAVINQQFRSLLLDDPEKALHSHYQGEPFLLTDEERALILSIRAENLVDLARQLIRTLDYPPCTLPTTSTYQ